MVSVKFENVSFSYENNREILKNITFYASNQDSVGIIGANGAGKSTLLKLLVGLQLNYTGSITVDDIVVNKQNLNQVRQKIGYVFQDSDSQLFMPTVYEDVAFAPRNYGLPEEEVKKRTLDALKRVNIEHLKDKPIYKLSGGEKKSASIATILSMEPEILLMDEPTVALDPKNRRNLIHILNSFKHMKMITSHDLDFIWDTCNKVVLVNNGEIIKIGDTKEILSDEKLLDENGLELPLSLYRR